MKIKRVKSLTSAEPGMYARIIVETGNVLETEYHLVVLWAQVETHDNEFYVIGVTTLDLLLPIYDWQGAEHYTSKPGQGRIVR